MQIKKLEDGIYEIWERPIRGYDWQLIRSIGKGTYAIIAGKTDNDDDEEIIIEEWDAPEKRAIWDNAQLLQVVAWAYDEILDTLKNETVTSVSDSDI
jgi:hypothetical protein